MNQLIDLDLHIESPKRGSYRVRLDLAAAGGAPSPLGTAMVPITEAPLLERTLDPPAYGRMLTDQLFRPGSLREAWIQAAGFRQGSAGVVRLGLHLAPGAAALHRLRWETILDPLNNEPLARSGRVLMRRVIAGREPESIPPPRSPKVLVVVAAPHDAASFGLTPVDCAAELSVVTPALGQVPRTILARQGVAAPPTFEALATALRSEPAIVFLVANGAFVDNESVLWLEDAQGVGKRVAGGALANLVRELRRPPALAVLSICRSGGASHASGQMQSLGPRLVGAGIPAVLAMHGDLSVNAAHRLLPAFFHELLRSGNVEQAVAAARVHAGDDWWLPVLFQRAGPPTAFLIPTPSTPQPGRNLVPPQKRYEHGLDVLQRRLPQEEQPALAATAGQLRAILEQERWAGGAPTVRDDKVRIILALNELALRRLGVSFTALCEGAPEI